MKKKIAVVVLAASIIGIGLFLLILSLRIFSLKSDRDPESHVSKPLSQEQKIAKCKDFLEYSYSLTCKAISSVPFEECEAGMREEVRDCLVLTGQDASDANVYRYRYPFAGYYCEWLKVQSTSPEEDVQGRQAFASEYKKLCTDVKDDGLTFCKWLRDKIDNEVQTKDGKKEVEELYQDFCINGKTKKP